MISIRFTSATILLLSAVLLWGCAEDDTPPADQELDGASFFDADYGKPLFDQAPAPGKEDSLLGRGGLPASVDQGDAVVWEVKNQWGDTTTFAAKEAGIAWPANSGLNWDEKFSLWVDQLESTQSAASGYRTFSLKTPWGFSVPGPSLECAEMAIFLRVTFASWYNLPFYMEAAGSQGRVYFGHFGALTSTGRFSRTPAYKTAYEDFSGMSQGAIAEYGWPEDEKLKARKIGGTSNQTQDFLFPGANAGAYFDKIYLNKRTGYFMTLLLSYFGSVNLADSNNTFNVKPEKTKPGDTLLERWQRRGIGHTLVVKEVNTLPDGRMEIELMSGSMPRRQAKWEDGPTSKRSLTMEETGGEGQNSEGDRYAALGGGMKRWRWAQVVDGVYRNVVPSSSRDAWVDSANLEAIAARPERYEALLGEVDPEALREVLLRIIDDKRAHLSRYPASCSARIGREEAFSELYRLNKERFDMTPEQTDRQFRKLEDYVFAELEYSKSKTCCWNSTTAAMYEIVMDYNAKHTYDADTQSCQAPRVFKNDGGYEVFKAHAASLGRAADWVEWSEDEPCAQRDVEADTEAQTSAAPYCEIAQSLLGINTPGCPADGFINNHSLSDAAMVSDGQLNELNICQGKDDWYVISLEAGQRAMVELSFDHSAADLDLELTSRSGMVLANSSGVSDEEVAQTTIAGGGLLYVRVFPYTQGASTSYKMNVIIDQE